MSSLVVADVLFILATQSAAATYELVVPILFHPSHSVLFIMPLLHTGRRRTKLDRKYNGPARQGPVRHISPAQLNLERVYEQNRLNAQKKDVATAPGPAPGLAAKGKPRLLLMGQRRYSIRSAGLKLAEYY